MVAHSHQLKMYGDDLVCKKCYELAKAKRFANGFAIIILILGIVACLTGVGAIIGIPAVGISAILRHTVRGATDNALTLYRVFKAIGMIIIGFILVSIFGGIGAMILDFVRYGF